MRPSFFFLFALFSLFTSLLWSLPVSTVEAGIIPCGLTTDDPNQAGDQTGKCTICHLIVGVNNIVILLRNVMSAIAVVVVVAMSFVYITSAGDESRMAFAKQGILASLIGFAIILLAWLLVNYILTLPIYNTNAGEELIRTDWQKLSCSTTSLAK